MTLADLHDGRGQRKSYLDFLMMPIAGWKRAVRGGEGVCVFLRLEVGNNELKIHAWTEDDPIDIQNPKGWG